jgi:hypothetical protein
MTSRNFTLSRALEDEDEFAADVAITQLSAVQQASN